MFKKGSGVLERLGNLFRKKPEDSVFLRGKKNKKKFISVKKNERILEINFDNIIIFLKSFFNSKLTKISLIGIFICIIFLKFFAYSSADVTKAELYPTYCLGSWQNPSQAAGLPDVANGGSYFSIDNSAYSSSNNQQLYCGGFKGDTPADAVPKKFSLKFSWLVTTNAITPVSGNDILQASTFDNVTTSTSIIDNTATSSTSTDLSSSSTTSISSQINSSSTSISTSSDIFSTTTSLNSSTSTNENSTSSSSSLLNDASSSSSSSVSLPDSTITLPSLSTTTTTDNTITLPSLQNSSSDTNATSSQSNLPSDNNSTNSSSSTDSTPTPSPDSSTSSSSTSSMSSDSNTVSFWQKIFSVAHAQDSTTTSDQNLNTVTATDTSASTSSISDIIVPSQNDLLEIKYTIDGTNWNKLGTVNAENWKDATFEISDPAITTWDDISKIQISITTLPTDGVPPLVYIDSAYLEVSYEQNPQIQPDNIPTINLKNSSGVDIISGDNDFSMSDSPTFVVTDPNFSKTDIVNLVKEKRVDVVSDPGGALNAAVEAVSTNSTAASSTVPVIENSTTTIPQDSPSTSTDTQSSSTTVSSNFNLIIQNFKNFFVPKVALAQTSVTSRITDVTIFDSFDKPTDIGTTLSTVTVNGIDHQQVLIDKPKQGFKPGLYKMKVTLATAEASIVSEQDFSWGVLSINMDRSIYRLGDQAYLQMGVLDNNGKTLCDAQLDLQITSPSGSISHLTTSYGSIKPSGVCHDNNFSTAPDYSAYFKPSLIGTYQLLLTATTINGVHSIHDSLNVVSSTDFDIVRTGPSRINPSFHYPVTLSFTPKHDFSGTIVETVPDSFDVSEPASTSTTPYDAIQTVSDPFNPAGPQLKTISWNVSVSKNQTTTLGYDFEGPPISPYLFLSGPAQVFDGSSSTSSQLFQETRKWQIASDSICTATVSGNWSAGASVWTDCGHIPTTNDTVVINSGVTVALDQDTATLGTVNISGTLDASALSCGSGTRSCNLNGTALTIASTGTYNAGTGSTATFNGTTGTILTLDSGGVFNAGTSTVNTKGSGTFTVNGGTGSFTGSNAFYNYSCTGVGSTSCNQGGDITVTNLFYDTGASFSTTASNYALTAGYIDVASLNLYLNTSTVTVTGTSAYPGSRTALISSAGTLFSASSTIIITGDDTLKVFANSPTVNNLIFNPTLSNDRTYTIGTPTLTGNLTSDPQTSSVPTTHTLYLSGSLTLSSSVTFYVQGDSYSTTQLLNNESIGFLNIMSGGILSAGGTTITVTASTGTSVTNNGSFIAGTSTIYLYGATLANAGNWTGSNAMYNLNWYHPIVLGADLTVTNEVTANYGFDTSASNYNFTLGYWHSGSVPTVNFHSSTITLTGTGPNPGYCAPSIFCGNGSWNTSSANFVVTSDGSPTIFGVALTVNNLTFSPALTGTNRAYTMGNMPTINGNFTINPSGTANTFTYTLPSAFTIGATKTITVESTGGSATGILDTSGSSYALSSGHYDIEPGGKLNLNGSAVSVTGTTGTLFTNNNPSTGALNSGTSTVTFTGAATSTALLNSGIFTTATNNNFYKLTINNASFNAPLGAALELSNQLLINLGTLNTSTSNCASTSCNIKFGSLYIYGASAVLTANSATMEMTGTGYPTWRRDSGGVFNRGTSTLLVTSSGAPIFPFSAETFYKITINSTSTVSLASTVTMSDPGNAFYIQNGTLSGGASLVGTAVSGVGTFTMDSGATFNTTGNTIGNYTVANIFLNTNSNQQIYGTTPSVIPVYGNLTLLASPSNPQVAAGTLTVMGNMTVIGSSGALTLNGTTNVAGTLIVNASGASFNTNGTSCPSGGCNITAGGLTVTAGTFRMWNSDDLNVSGSVLISGGILNMWNASTFEVSGNFTNNGTFSRGSSTVNFNGTSISTISGSSAITFYNLVESGSGTVNTSIPIAVANNMTISSGTFDDNGNLVTGNVTGTLSVAAGATLKLGSAGAAFPTNFTTAHTTIDNNSTVVYNSTLNQVVSTVPTSYGNLEFSAASGSPTKSLAGLLTVNGSLTIDAGNTLDVTAAGCSGVSCNILLGGNFTNNGTFNSETGDVKLSGPVTQTISGNFTAGLSSQFYDLDITNNSGVNPSGPGISGMTASVYFGSDITVSHNYTINVAHSREEYRSGNTFTATNIAWTGTTGAGNDIYFRGSSGTWYLNVSGTQSVNYVDVSDSDASGGSSIAAYSGTNTDSTGNTNWAFVLTTVTISGNAYDNATTTVWSACDGVTQNISLKIDGGTTTSTTCNALTGFYSFSAVVTGSDVVAVFMNGTGSTDQGVIVTTLPGSPSGTYTLNPHKGFVWIQTESGATAMNNSRLSHSDSTTSGASNVPYTVTSGNLTVSNGIELRVSTSASYAPAGNVTTNTFTILGTYSGAVETLTLTGTSGTLFTNSGTFSSGNDTVAFTGNGSPTLFSGTFNTPSSALYNLVLSPTINANRIYNTGVAISVDNNFTVSPAGTARTLTVDSGGNYSITGKLTVQPTGSALAVFDTSNGSGVYYSLNAAAIDVEPHATFNANSSTIKLNGTTSPIFTNNGSFSAGTSHVVISSNAPVTLFSGTFTLTSAFYNLEFSPTLTGSQNYSGGTGVSVSNNFTIDPSGGGGSQLTYTLAGDNNITGTFLVQPATGTYALVDTDSVSSWSIEAQNIDLEIQSTINLNGSTLTLTGTSGTLFTNNNGTVNSASSTVLTSGSGSSTLSAGMATSTFANVNIAGLGTVSLGESFVATGLLTVSSGVFDTTSLGHYPVSAGYIKVNGGTLTLNSSSVILSGTGSTPLYTLSSGTISPNTAPFRISGIGSATIASGSPLFYSLRLSASGTKTLAEPLSVTNALTISAGTLDTTSASHWDISTGSLSINSSSATFSPNSSNLNITGTSGTLITYSAGTVSSNTMTTNLIGNGSATLNSGTFAFYNLVDNSTGTKTLGALITINNSFTVSNGTIDDNGFQITGGSNTLTLASGTVLKLGGLAATTFPVFAVNTLDSSSTVVYNASVAQTISGTPVYGNLQISNAGTKTLGGNLTTSGNLTIDASNTLDTGSGLNYNINVLGNWINNGTFTPRNGTVYFLAPGTQSISGDNSWYGLNIHATTTRTVYFDSSKTQTVASGGIITLLGSSTSTGLLILSPNTASTTWLLNVDASATQAVSYVNPSYSNAASGTTILANDGTSIDGGSNTNWSFFALIYSVTVTANGTISYGTLPAYPSASSSQNTISLGTTPVIQNNGNTSETLLIKGQNTACPWTLVSTTPSTDTYNHEFSTSTGSTWNYLATSYNTLVPSIAASSTQNVDLKVTVPASSSCTNVQSTDITVMATP